MSAKRKRIMVSLVDGGGFPRAWAIAPKLDAARQEARRQLLAYIAKKWELGEPLSVKDFTEKIEAVES